MSEVHEDHGHTIAAWTGVVIITLGFLIGTFGLVIASPTVFWIGIAVIPAGVMAGRVLALMGFGKQGK